MPKDPGDMPQGLRDVCDSVRNLRAATGLTQADFAELAGISEPTVKNFEGYRKNWEPSEDILAKISRASKLDESRLSDIRKGHKPKIPAPEPTVKRKPEDYLEEISSWMGVVNEWMSGVNAWMCSVDERLASIDTTLGKRATRPDIDFRTEDDPPEIGA